MYRAQWYTTVHIHGLRAALGRHAKPSVIGKLNAEEHH
jgi:hypothetical protein